MKVKSVVPRGYCKGVVRAINLAKEARKNFDGPIYILGMIVHNEYVTTALEHYHIITLNTSLFSKIDLINSIENPTNAILIFTAHGSDEKLIEIARSRGLKIIDATCTDVKKTADIIKAKLANNYQILYIGKRKHNEALAIQSISNDIHIIENKDDLASLSFNNQAKLFLTTQTTMSIYETKVLADYIKALYPQVEIELEICNATRIRQEAILNLENIDVLIVVGDPTSNNANNLKDINKHIKKRYLVRSVNDIDISWFDNNDSIAVTSSASTPTYLTNQVIDYLSQLTLDNPSTYQKPTIDETKIL